MILNIIVTILSALGIYGFYIDNYILLLIGSIAVIIEVLIGIFSGALKGIIPEVIASILGIIFTQQIFVGIGIGLCLESLIMSILGWIILISNILYERPKKQKKIKISTKEPSGVGLLIGVILIIVGLIIPENVKVSSQLAEDAKILLSFALVIVGGIMIFKHKKDKESYDNYVMREEYKKSKGVK